MKVKKSELIICPECGAQYLPREIFIPNRAFGKDHEIIKNQWGEILDFRGLNLDLQETYCCDYCKNTFKVSAKLNLYTTSCKQKVMDDEYVSPLRQEKIVLSEG